VFCPRDYALPQAKTRCWVACFFSISSVFLRCFFGHSPKKHRRNTEEIPKKWASHRGPQVFILASAQ
jgi:hypothetical protein